MLTLPPRFQRVISLFSPTFRKDVWPKVQLLITAAIICPGSRTVCNLLRTVGLQDDRCFPKYHRVLSQDKWSMKWLAGVLLRLLVDTFVAAEEALVFGLDDTIERRWGRKIRKRAIYRDPVRSSRSHFVKCSGLRWMSLMLLTGLPWLAKGAYWALPVLTALCPSKRFYESMGKKPKLLTDWARQIIHWLARHTRDLKRPVFLVGDGSFATYQLFMDAHSAGIGIIAPLKLNSRLFALPPKRYPKTKRGPKPPIGKRLLCMSKRVKDGRVKWREIVFSEWYGNKEKEMLITSGIAIWHKSNKVMVKVRWILIKDPEEKLDPVLLACTDTELPIEQVVTFFVRRWRVEVTFAEVRRHLGVETQRQWSDLAIERTTPCLMGLMSIICLMANKLHQHSPIEAEQTAWYQKRHVTFSDVLAKVRVEIWRTSKLSISPFYPDIGNYPAKIRHLWFLLTQAVA